jgi:hypothetical protein
LPIEIRPITGGVIIKPLIMFCSKKRRLPVAWATGSERGMLEGKSAQAGYTQNRREPERVLR